VHKCEFPDGVRIFPDGRNELDACTYEEIERWKNVTISVLRCKVCGHVELAWYRQDDTEQVDADDFD